MPHLLYPSAHLTLGDRSSLLCLCRVAVYGCDGQNQRFTATGDPEAALMAPTDLVHSGGGDDSEGLW